MVATATDIGDYGNEDLLSECEDYVDANGMNVDDDTIGGFQSTYHAATGSKKGVSFDPSVAFTPTKLGKKVRSGTGSWSHSITLPYMAERWTDEFLNERSSVQVHLLSGDNPDKKVRYRVSSNQDEWIVEFLVNQFMMTPEGSFNSHIMNQEAVKADLSGGILRMLSRILMGHAKTIARRWIAMAMKGRDTNKKQIWLQMRVPLGLKARHQPVTKDEDDLFNGIKYIVNKGDGAVMLHAEFIGLQKDGYSPMKDDASVRSAAAEFAYAPSVCTAAAGDNGVPKVINLDSSESEDSTWKEWKTIAEDDEMSLVKSIEGMSIRGNSNSSICSNRNPFSRKPKANGKKKSLKRPPTSPNAISRAGSAPAGTGTPNRRSSRNTSPPKRFRPAEETPNEGDEPKKKDE